MMQRPKPPGGWPWERLKKKKNTIEGRRLGRPSLFAVAKFGTPPANKSSLAPPAARIKKDRGGHRSEQQAGVAQRAGRAEGAGQVL